MAEPDSTAVRTALWRATHVLVDPPPHVFEDLVGLELAAPEGDWRSRPDLDPGWTGPFRAGMVARGAVRRGARADRATVGVGQYVLLGAGLDSFSQRRPSWARRCRSTRSTARAAALEARPADGDRRVGPAVVALRPGRLSKRAARGGTRSSKPGST